MVKKNLLSNGLRAITIPMPHVKSVTALVMVAAGSRYEDSTNNGVSHFLEHMVFKGTKKRPNKLAISSLLDGLGASYNAFTSKEYTGFFVKAAAENIETVVEVLSDILQNSLFTQEEIDKDKGVIIEEINMYEDEPSSRVFELFEQLLYSGSPLAMRISGPKEIVASMTHDQIVNYFNKMYNNRSVVVGLSGKIGEEPVKLLEKYYGKIKEGPVNPYVPATNTQTKPASLVYYKETDQAHLCLGVRAYPLDHPDRYVLDLLGTILGGNMSSRLFHEVREKRGLAYSIGAGSEEYLDCGYVLAQGGLQIPKVSEAIKVILEQFDVLRNHKVTPTELRRAKDYWRGKMVLALEDTYRVANFYVGKEVLLSRMESPDQVLEQVEKVTQEDILRVAKDIFVKETLNLSVIGPFKNEKEFDKILSL